MQLLFILLFFTGVVPLDLPIRRQLYMIKQNKQWSDAWAYCKATNTNLAIIKSDDHMVRFQNEVQRQQYFNSVWIGVYKVYNTWRWSMESEPLGSMTTWSTGEPNNLGGNENCVLVSTSGWNDSPCTSAFPSVCFDGNYTGNNRYIYISTTMSWSAAQTYCRNYHTDLASARDAAEISITMGLTSGWTWFGLYRDYWKWTDQTVLSTNIWMSGQPDDDDVSKWTENCACISNGQAADAVCSSTMPFVCYRDLPVTSHKQIIKLKVRSNQDANHPAVKVAILEQLMQKLKDQGIKVKWRQQPDGNVFYKEKTLE